MPIKFPSLGFGSKPRSGPGLAVTSQDHTRFRTSPDKGIGLNPPDHQLVLSRWRRLGSLSPKSHDYQELLGTLVDTEGDGKVALELAGNDAQIVINIIDEVLKSGGLRKRLARCGLFILRKLADNTGQLPDSYSVTRGVELQVEQATFACGVFADIRKGTLGGKTVAVKTIRVARDSNFPIVREKFCKESMLWTYVSHPNVLGLIAVNIDPQSGALSLISELMEEGNIVDYIRVSAADRIRLLQDVTRGLSYLHDYGVVHGNLKGANILIKSGVDPMACISDFGSPTLTSTTTFAVPMTGDEYKGTLSHMAPELLYPNKFGLHDSQVSKLADIYAFGVVVYEVLTGRPPFEAGRRRHAEIILCIMEGERPRKPEKAEDIGFGGGTWEFIQRCWNQDRENRPTAERAYGHFQRAAKASSIIPPGPTIPPYEEGPTTSKFDNGSRDLTRPFVSPQRETGTHQQAKVAADPMGSGSIHSSLYARSAEFPSTKPSLFERFGSRVVGQRRAPRLGAPKSLPA